MKTIYGILAGIAFLLISACNPQVITNIDKAYPPIDYRQKIAVIGLEEKEPEDAVVLGEVKIGDTGFTTNCGYEIVLYNAKIEARKTGGNAIKITEHIPPQTQKTTCHKITAQILKIENVEKYLAKKEKRTIQNTDHATLKIYRFNGIGPLVSYNLHLDDSVICRVKNNFKKTLRIKKKGPHTLWAKTETKAKATVNFQPGKTYYLRCSVSMGAFVGRPKLEIVDQFAGKEEFESFKAKNK